MLYSPKFIPWQIEFEPRRLILLLFSFFFLMGNLKISLTNNRRQMDYILSTRVLNKPRSFLQRLTTLLAWEKKKKKKKKGNFSYI